jgi:hypothetical protein
MPIPNKPIPLNVYLHPKFFIARILKDDKAEPKYIPPFYMDVAVVLLSGGK